MTGSFYEKFNQKDKRMVLSCAKTSLVRCGSVLILVLIIVSGMATLSIGMTYRIRTEMKLAQTNAQRTKVCYLALGGIERAKTLLNSQPLTPENIGKICQFSSTATDEKLFEQIKNTDSYKGVWLSYKVRDEYGYLNVNKSEASIWGKIGISKECQSGILNWLGTDNGSGQNGEIFFTGGKSEFPYVPKGSPCVVLKELLFARGVTQEEYLGKYLCQNFYMPAGNEDKDFRDPLENIDNSSDFGLMSIFTVYGKGKININTVPKMILASLPGLDEETADRIITYRGGPDAQLGTDDDRYLTAPDALADLDGLTQLQTELLQEYCCFKSDCFRIFSFAGINGFNCCLMATISYTENCPQVLTVERLL